MQLPQFSSEAKMTVMQGKQVQSTDYFQVDHNVLG